MDKYSAAMEKKEEEKAKELPDDQPMSIEEANDMNRALDIGRAWVNQTKAEEAEERRLRD